jgi:hypothetical protein
MNFLSKLKDAFLSFPFPLQIILGVVLLNIIPPLGIGIIIFAVVIRKKNRYNRNSVENDYYTGYKDRKRNNQSIIFEEKKQEEYYNIKKQNLKNYKNTHLTDLKSAERILHKIKEYLKKEKLKDELKSIYSKMLKEYENAKKISIKITEINNILNDEDWNLNKINKNIEDEKNKITQDPKRLDRMYEMRSHVQQLIERKERLANQISDLNMSFQTIYTKITLLDIQSENSFDEIETEIQRILDFKLKVDHYEDKLDKELKDFV